MESNTRRLCTRRFNRKFKTFYGKGRRGSRPLTAADVYKDQPSNLLSSSNVVEQETTTPKQNEKTGQEKIARILAEHSRRRLKVYEPKITQTGYGFDFELFGTRCEFYFETEDEKLNLRININPPAGLDSKLGEYLEQKVINSRIFYENGFGVNTKRNFKRYTQRIETRGLEKNLGFCRLSYTFMKIPKSKETLEKTFYDFIMKPILYFIDKNKQK